MHRWVQAGSSLADIWVTSLMPAVNCYVKLTSKLAVKLISAWSGVRQHGAQRMLEADWISGCR
jgi:hypothetical protein